MDYFPPEIWEQIFIVACTDSGRTGLSLSLVSRYFRNVSRSCQYQSVSLTRSKHIPLFRRTLSHAPLEARRIKYLYVCCPDVFLDVSDKEDSDYVASPMAISGSSGSSKSMQFGSDSSGEEYEGSPTAEEFGEALDESIALRVSYDPPSPPQGPDVDMHVWDDLDEDIQTADVFILEALHDILREASSSLLILSVNWTSFRPLLLEELLFPLPNLVELHLCRNFTSQDEINPETEDTTPTLFPRLERLHIFGYADQRPDSFGQSLGRIAPSLTHIRMPNYYIRRLPSESTRFPDTIQKVVFEPFSASEFVGTANIRQILFGTGVHSKEISIAVREWSDDPKGWEKSWMERVIGSRGPW